MKEQNILTTAQVARLAGCARTTVQFWGSTGKLSSVRVGDDQGPFGGQARLFSRREVEEFIKQRRRERAKRKSRAKKG
jgi:excisionase family DNA binding protein